MPRRRTRIRAEAEEETGYRLGDVQKVFEAFMSPGSVTEKLHFFVAEYESTMQVGSGGGLADEGEDIEVLELPIDEALAHDRRRPHRRRQDHHAAAIRGAEYFQVRRRSASSGRCTSDNDENNPMHSRHGASHPSKIARSEWLRWWTMQ